MNTTLKHFIKHSHINAKLIRAVVKQSGGWEDFKESASGMAQCIDGGFQGFIYYTDTVAFFKRNRVAILELAERVADDMGEDMLTLIQGFGCFRKDRPSQGALCKALYQGKGEDATNIMNCMTWFAGEEVARSYTDLENECHS